VGRLQRKKSPGAKKKKKPKVASGDSRQIKKEVAVSLPDESAQGIIKQPVVATKKQTRVITPAPIKRKDNFFSKTLQFLREVKVELKKVTWPSRKQTIGSTVVVIILVTIIAFFLGAVDIGLSSLVRIVLQ
jgi:preprotein translocase subunit SecE